MRGNGGFTYDDKVRNILNLNRVIGMVSSHIIVIHNKESPCVNNGISFSNFSRRGKMVGQLCALA
jgi:hypothetical protein